MKKIALLLLSIPFVISSCNKKEYAQFQTTRTTPMYQNTETNSVEIMTTEASNPLTLKVTEELSAITPEASVSEILDVQKDAAMVTPETKKVTFSTKIQALKDIKEVKKELKSIQKLDKTKAVGTVDTIALLSLIFGGLGLITLGVFGLGILLGIAGLVLGIIALKRNSPQKVLAIIGVSLGSVAIFIGLLFLVFLATFFNSNYWR